MEKKLLRIAAVICMAVSVMFAWQVTAFADEVKPIHEYNFDSDNGTSVVDSTNEEKKIGGIANGTNSSTFVTGYNGTGNARQFNGTDDYLSYSDPVIPLGAKTIRFKFKKDASTVATTAKWEMILSTLTSSEDNGFGINIGSVYEQEVPGSLCFYSKSSSSYIFLVYTPKSVCDGKWHDIMFTWDGTKSTNSVKIYVDDMTTPIVQATPTSTESKTRSNLSVGSSEFTGWNNNICKLNGYLDDIQIYDSVITPSNTSSNLKATGGDSKIDLTWDAVTDATSYTIKRSTTTGGPYTSIATDVTDTTYTYTDSDVINGTTYYYIITAIVDGRENGDSDEASATPNAGQATQPEDAKLKVVLEVAESLRLSVDDDLDVNTEMAWSSSDETVATVNEKGIVTALGLGNTVITVKSVDGSYTDSINVLVVENAEDYRLAIDLKVGETSRLTVDDLTDTVNVTWAPMDSAIANVTSKGKVTALSKGLVLITTKDEDGNIIGKVYVRVRE